jgi:tryptophan 2,3-dioxygenase
LTTREAADRASGSAADVEVLREFLAIVLDKHEGRYNYISYIGVNFLAVPPSGDREEDQRARDEWLILLMADAYEFEVAALAGRERRFPLMRPPREVVEKRLRLIGRILSPVLARRGLAWVDGFCVPDHPSPQEAPLAPPPELTEGLVLQLLRKAPPALALSMLPVYIMHDEYLFIRVLQAFEVTFALLALHLRQAIQAMESRQFVIVPICLNAAAEVLEESTPLFSLLATMQRDAFRTFRRFTEGASAIQSTNYKTLEALCRTPSPSRLDSAAFNSVPIVRESVLQGMPTFDEAIGTAISSREIPAQEMCETLESMGRLEAAHQRWKQTHYKLAVRMLGTERGTGYTEGTPYLKTVLENRLFPISEDTPCLQNAATAFHIGSEQQTTTEAI